MKLHFQRQVVSTSPEWFICGKNLTELASQKGIVPAKLICRYHHIGTFLHSVYSVSVPIVAITYISHYFSTFYIVFLHLILSVIICY